MFFPLLFPVSLLQVTTVLLASILQIHGAQQGTWGWPPARVWLEAVSCRGEKLGVAFCLEQKASFLPGWRRDESTALSSGGMAICPAQLALWASIPSPSSAAGRNDGSAESVWLSSKGLDMQRSLSDSLHFICVSMQHILLVLHRVKHWPAPVSADMHLAAGYLDQVITAALPSSPSARWPKWWLDVLRQQWSTCQDKGCNKSPQSRQGGILAGWLGCRAGVYSLGEEQCRLVSAPWNGMRVPRNFS